jgi:hypothetical protein
MTIPMIELLTRPLWLIAQAEGEAAVAAEGQATGAPSTSLIEVILGNPLNLLLISGILFVLLVLRPQQKQMKNYNLILKIYIIQEIHLMNLFER